MRLYWDTSAAINAVVSSRVYARLEAGTDQHVTRSHALAEFFSTMTGRGVDVIDEKGQPARLVFDPNDCAAWLSEFAGKVELVEVEGQELLQGLARAQSLNVAGARVYDYGHALAAIKAGADAILTRNTEHFAGLTKGIPIQWP